MHKNISGWFYLEPYVYIVQKERKYLLYNTLDCKALSFENEPLILSLTKKLLDKNTNGFYGVGNTDLTNPVLTAFFKKVKGSFMGDILPATNSRQHPFLMRGKVKNQRDVKVLKSNPSRSLGEDILKYLQEMTIYLPSTCDLKCEGCRNYYRQFRCCTVSLKKTTLSHADVIALLDQLRYMSLQRIAFAGGNFLSYNDFGNLFTYLENYPHRTEFVLHMEHLQFLYAKFKNHWPKKSFLRVMIFPPFLEKNIMPVFTIAKEIKGLRFSFVVQSSDDLKFASRIIDKTKIRAYDIKPFFNGNNLNFFRKNVFLEVTDIIKSHPTMKDIYANQTVNRLNFGSLTIMSNGDIHSNINAPALGNIKNDSIYQALYRELDHLGPWLKVRKTVEPCRKCLYADLCPPLGNYENALKQNNLCHIR